MIRRYYKSFLFIYAMKEKFITKIALTPDEQALWEQICFAPINEDEDKLQVSIESAYQLSRSLLKRKAIPAIRWNYFTDPELNTRGYRKSRKEVFEENGARGDEILRHPHFHKYLRYFVLGPEIPSTAINEFAELAKQCAPITSGDTREFCSLAKKQVKNLGLNPKNVAEEYFKLGLELELGEDIAYAVRRDVMQMNA